MDGCSAVQRRWRPGHPAGTVWAAAHLVLDFASASKHSPIRAAPGKQRVRPGWVMGMQVQVQALSKHGAHVRTHAQIIHVKPCKLCGGRLVLAALTERLGRHQRCLVTLTHASACHHSARAVRMFRSRPSHASSSRSRTCSACTGGGSRCGCLSSSHFESMSMHGGTGGWILLAACQGLHAACSSTARLAAGLPPKSCAARPGQARGMPAGRGGEDARRTFSKPAAPP